jgi:hypothetical protein
VVKKLTTVVVVDDIERALPFWEGLGYARVAEVPHGDRIGFVILAGDGTQLMLQSVASVREDIGVEGERFLLYTEVSSLDEARAAVPGAKVLIERRTTSYGATETWIRDPAGTIVAFSTH